MFLLAAQSFGQSKYNFTICCIEYEKGTVHFSVNNNSDSIVAFTFVNIEKEGQDQVIKHYRISRDTLLITLFAEKKYQISASGNLDYSIDGEPYYQRTISAHNKLVLAIKLKRRFYSQLKYLKIILPDKTKLFQRIK